jgi:multicomponent Na+:H+ antiporter subunit F
MGKEDCRMIEYSNELFIALIFLAFAAAMALIRIIRGPTPPDRVVGLDTINTIVIVSMVIFGAAFNEVIYIDVAIVYALLSYISTLFIAKYLEGGRF